MSVVLTDKNGNLLANKPVDIEINNVKYTRITDENGIARLNINLNIGSYPVGVSYAGDDEYNKSTGYCRVFVSPKLTVHDLNMKYCDGSKFTAKLTDIEDNPLQGINVLFKVNGVPYTRATNNEGIASLNINLSPGDYNILTYAVDAVNSTIHIDKCATRMEGTDINKTFSEKVAYQCAVYDVNNNRVPGVVNITVNGKTYPRTPDANGLYKLNINLQPGTYILNAEFLGNNVYLPSSVQNTITVKEVPVAPQKSRSEKILDEFEKYFGKCEYIDDALAKIQGNGYAFYFSDGYNMYDTIIRIAKGQGANCYDSAELFYHLMLGMNTKYGRNYEPQYLHVWCPVSNYDHIRLRFKSNGKGWYYRDPASVLSGNGVESNWCGTSNNIMEVNPSFILDG
ncbi:MAG: hypothetical protein J6M91_07980 [Methanobrevibacter sp.]|nr:hypothetical protein [Methanobrevibacter sp.]